MLPVAFACDGGAGAADTAAAAGSAGAPALDSAGGTVAVAPVSAPARKLPIAVDRGLAEFDSPAPELPGVSLLTLLIPHAG